MSYIHKWVNIVIDILGISLFVWVMIYAKNYLEYMSVYSITLGMEIYNLSVLTVFESWILQRIISSFLSFFLLCHLWTNRPKLFIFLHLIWEDVFIILFYFWSLELIALIKVEGFMEIYFRLHYAPWGH